MGPCSFLVLQRPLSKSYGVHLNLLLRVDRKKWRVTYRRKTLDLGKGEKWVGEKAVGKLLKKVDRSGIQKDEHNDMPRVLF